MKIIKKNPFDVDPKKAMIEAVASEANLSGEPLSDNELTILAAENPEVDDRTEDRLRRLVAKVIKRQQESGQSEDPKSFVNAIEWASDLEYSYVLALAVAETSGSVTVDRIYRRDIPKPLVYFGCIGIIALVLGVLWMLGKLFSSLRR